MPIWRPDDFPRHSDAYHTCYNLVGLSAAQHRYTFRKPTLSTESDPQPVSFETLGSAFHWVVDKNPETDADIRALTDDDQVGAVHPLFVLPWGAAEQARRFYEAKGGF